VRLSILALGPVLRIHQFVSTMLAPAEKFDASIAHVHVGAARTLKCYDIEMAHAASIEPGI